MKRCKPDHPTVAKLNQLWDLADSLGIHMQFIGDTCLLSDRDYPGRTYRVEDIDNDGYGTAVCEFPFSFETKLTFEEEVG